MTAKEAIKNIKGLLDGCCGPELDDTREAFDLAIKALEAQDGTDTNVGSTISRQAAINAVEHITSSMSVCVTTDECHGMKRMQRQAVIELANLSSAQPDGISLEWIDKHLEWLDNCDNDFAQFAKVGIRAMVEIWKKDKT